jgi:alpha-tubulin suppressor-like RCC1 family protein
MLVEGEKSASQKIPSKPPVMDSVIDMKLSRASLCLLTSSGHVFEHVVDAGARFPRHAQHFTGFRLLQIPEANFIVEISAGARHFLMLDSKSNVFGFGASDHGQLGTQQAWIDTPMLIVGKRLVFSAVYER